MPIIKICASIGLGVWVGGLTLWMGVVTPTVFRSLKKEEAGRFLGVLFPAVDRWASVWGLVSAGFLFLLFYGRHFEPRSLVLELPVLVMLILTLYCTFILHPQVRDLKGKLGREEFQGTAHLETVRFAFSNLHKRSVQLHLLILILGWFSLGLVPGFLE